MATRAAHDGVIPVSQKATRTTNPIRKIVDNLVPDPNHEKSFLNLALGDPTIFGTHLQCPSVLLSAVTNVLRDNNHNGYLPSFGSAPARQSIAVYSSRPDSVVSADDIIIASGCSGALDLAITCLLNEGDNILVPMPGFPLYEVIAKSLGASVKHYPLLPDKNWECDIAEMECLIDERTRAILVNNPSNPCGSNFSKEHLTEIVAVAEAHHLPIIADEIYGGLVFDGEFTPIQSVRKNVPLLTVGGIAKEFVVPGWRVGWIVIHDHTGRLVEVRKGLRSLTQLVLGATSIVQGALSAVLTPVPDSEDAKSLAQFHHRYCDNLKENARLCGDLATRCPALKIAKPRGAMYAMISIDFTLLDGSMANDEEFSKQLLAEENLIILPGACFKMAGTARLVICPPAPVLSEAMDRIVSFCHRHRRVEEIEM